MGRTHNQLTVAAYEAAADQYVAASPAEPRAEVVAMLDTVARAVGPGGRVLEIGSGPGRDARLLTVRGVTVRPTDAAQSFVDMMRADGLPADRLDVLTDELGGPYDAIYAGAVLLHLTRRELPPVLERLAAVVIPGGLLACTFKRGDGAAWSTAKLDRARHFTYWQPPELSAVFAASPWETVELREVAGRLEDWLFVVCRRA